MRFSASSTAVVADLGFPVFLTAYDPSDLPGGSVVPLGIERGYLHLADKILPGLTNVASQPAAVFFRVVRRRVAGGSGPARFAAKTISTEIGLPAEIRTTLGLGQCAGQPAGNRRGIVVVRHSRPVLCGRKSRIAVAVGSQADGRRFSPALAAGPLRRDWHLRRGCCCDPVPLGRSRFCRHRTPARAIPLARFRTTILVMDFAHGEKTARDLEFAVGLRGWRRPTRRFARTSS